MPAGVPVQVRLSDGELSALDSYRREKLNPPSRGRALRELARMGLQGQKRSDTQSQSANAKLARAQSKLDSGIGPTPRFA
jgi:hypothetical protein